MRRLSTFVLGMVAGGILLYGALTYHLIHAADGLHLVPKVESTLAESYVDIRGFTPADWASRPGIALALLQAERNDLLQSAANDSVRNSLEKFLPPPPQ